MHKQGTKSVTQPRDKYESSSGPMLTAINKSSGYIYLENDDDDDTEEDDDEDTEEDDDEDTEEDCRCCVYL